MVLRCLNGTADFAFSQPYEESGDLTINFNDKLAKTTVSACYFSSRVSKLAVSRLISRTLAVQRLMTRDVRVPDQSGCVGQRRTGSGGYLIHTNVHCFGFSGTLMPSIVFGKIGYFRKKSGRFDRVYTIKYLYSEFENSCIPLISLIDRLIASRYNIVLLITHMKMSAFRFVFDCKKYTNI